MAATIQKNGTSIASPGFQNGVLSIPRRSGFFRVDAPTLLSHTLKYKDETGEKTISGIPFYVAYIKDLVGKYRFLPDYNARYTILAGDSYLDEASSILYDTMPGASQSLAVTTVTTSPYEKDALFSLFPGG